MTKFLFLLLLIFLTVNSRITTQPVWPVKRDIDLSSGFGDFRQNRFHAGIDIRTGGKEGEQIFAPTDGWLFRIKMAYDGYGKGLYIQDGEGYIYVFGHLKDFSEKIDKIVKSFQMKTKRYYFDKYYLRDSIFIKQGELIGYSGQTGTGAPHLHFEKRFGENFPLNPLTHGFIIDDNVKPVFNQLIFKMLDDNSVFNNGKREMAFDVISDNNNNYYIETTVILQNKVGIIIDVFDQMRIGGMKQTVTNLSLLIDGQTAYEVVHDTLDFGNMRTANLEFDYNRAVDNQKTFRRLYHAKGNSYNRSYSPDNSGGILDPVTLFGKHAGEIIATDSYGNKSSLKFDFQYLPVIQPDKETDNKINYSDSVFEHTSINYQILDEGLLITASGDFLGKLNSEIRIYTDDKLLGIEQPLTVNESKTACFISPQINYPEIDKIEYIIYYESNTYIRQFDSLNIFAVGFDDKKHFKVGDMNLTINKDDLYVPQFIEIKSLDNIYEILPESFPCKKSFMISNLIDTTFEDFNKYGLYWYNKKKKEWLWIKSNITKDTLYSLSEGGGMFTVLIDTIPLTISNLSIKHLKTYFTSKPKISFIIKDDLSWIEDDRNFLVTLDNEWLIPEYDTEQKLFQTKPNYPLDNGDHILKIQVTDRAGNKFEQTVEFYINEKQTINKGN